MFKKLRQKITTKSLLLCPLSVFSSRNNTLLHCQMEYCMFWDKEEQTCVMRLFFLGYEESFKPSEEITNEVA